MRKLGSLIFSVLFWLFAGAVYSLIRFYGTSDQMDGITSDQSTITLWFIGSSLFGLTYWLSEILSNTHELRQKSYGFTILFRSSFLVLMTVVMVLMTRVAAFVLGNISSTEIVPTLVARLSSKPTLVFLLYVFLVASILTFFKHVREMIGARVLWELIQGKYFHPKQETRIFLFLDLKSSTQHAEKLGHIRYSQLIRDCFNDLTDSAQMHRAEIYQYAGDEAVLTWRIGSGLKNANCIMFYFDFLKSIESRKTYYLNEYGLLPEFKAGANVGSVTVAEIGILKREIAYHGDAINTASRIQGCCNEFKKAFLISDSLKKLVDRHEQIHFEPLGPVPLKGKQDQVQIFAAHLDSRLEPGLTKGF